MDPTLLTVAEASRAIHSGELSPITLAEAYLERIAAYNMQGPALHAIITVNPKAMETAADMDRSYRADSATVGLLHCIPTIAKDNFNTFDMPTTGGNIGKDLGATRRRLHGRQDT